MTDGRVFKVKLPMRMKTNKHGELESLNLNVYRNLHYYKMNYQKKAFQDFVKALLFGLPSMEAVKLHYEINPKGGSRLDTMNVGSVVDKFFSDALVHYGIIPDDDYKHVVKNEFEFGHLCPDDPHVLVTITETKTKEESPMRILLDESEIQQALEAYVKTMGIEGAAGVELSLNGDEIQAEILMVNGKSKPATVTHTTTETSDQPRKRGGRVPGSKNKPKGIISNVATTTEAGDDLNGSGDSEAGEEEDSPDEAEDVAKSKGSKLDLFGESFDSSDEEVDGTESNQPSSGSIPRGNPSGASDTESSETTDPDQEGSSDDTEEEAPAPVRGKRPSIFDAD